MATKGYINTPPADEKDYLIVKGMLVFAGITTRDPAEGVKLSPSRPEDYVFETKGPGIIAGLSVCIAGITLITGLRLYLRCFCRQLKWGWDDVLMIPGLLTAVAYPALQICMVKYGGAGKHIYDVTYKEYYKYKWMANISSIDFFVCVGIVKMSITVFNLRLTSMSSYKWKIANWTFFSLCLIYTLVAFFLNIFQCSPPGASFDLLISARSDKPPKCLGFSEMTTILRTINIILDYCLLTVPIIVLSKVQMSWKKKARLIALFCVGGLACVGSVMTLVSKFRLKTDALWNYTGILGWSLCELSLGVIAASLPTLGFLLPTSFGTSSSSHKYNSHSSRRGMAQTSPSSGSSPRGAVLVHDAFHKESSSMDSSRMDHRGSKAESDTVAIVRQHDLEGAQNWPSDADSDEYRADVLGPGAGSGAKSYYSSNLTETESGEEDSMGRVHHFGRAV